MSEPSYSSDSYSSSSRSSPDLTARKGYCLIFPDKDFDYGDNDAIVISSEGKAKYLDALLNIRIPEVRKSGKTKKIFPWPPGIAPFVSANPPGKDRKRRKTFPERQEELVKDIGDDTTTTPKKFWLAVLEHFPPRFMARDVLHHLCTIKPMAQPSDTARYQELMNKAEACREAGAAASWRAIIKKSARLPDEALIEAVRIYGSSSHSFGCLPPVVSNALKDAGIHFLAVDRDKRIVPQRWQAAADRAGIAYAKVGPDSLKASASDPQDAKRNNSLYHKSSEDVKSIQERHQYLANISEKVHDLENLLKDTRKDLKTLKLEVKGLRERVEKLDDELEGIMALQET